MWLCPSLTAFKIFFHSLLELTLQMWVCERPKGVFVHKEHSGAVQAVPTKRGTSSELVCRVNRVLTQSPQESNFSLILGCAVRWHHVIVRCQKTMPYLLRCCEDLRSNWMWFFFKSFFSQCQRPCQSEPIFSCAGSLSAGLYILAYVKPSPYIMHRVVWVPGGQQSHYYNCKYTCFIVMCWHFYGPAAEKAPGPSIVE